MQIISKVIMNDTRVKRPFEPNIIMNILMVLYQFFWYAIRSGFG